MHLKVHQIGKHYHQQWLFRRISFDLNAGDRLAILGRNGSGKSTLLQIIYGLIQAAEGEVLLDQAIIENPHQVFNYTAPLMALPLEFSIEEIHNHQVEVGKMSKSLSDFIEYAEFTKLQANKPIQYFSSGMLQRLKTALCLAGNAPIKLLDEPLSNMDKEGEIWYSNCMSKLNANAIVIVASNYEAEYHSIAKQITL